MEDSLTPMMRQFREMKKELPSDCLLLFRMGDFYEVFFEDAKIAAPLLDVALTKRAGVPMCGIPYHALEAYLPKLLNANRKVAIAEQTEDPRFAKGIVKRQIMRIVTPGTILDSSILSPKRNNYLAALAYSKPKFGLAFIDISTGDFRTTEIESESELAEEMLKLNAPECILPESLHNEFKEKNKFPLGLKNILWTPLDDWIFSLGNASEFLKRHFSVASLDGFGCRNMIAGVCSAGAILQYACENLRQTATHIRRLTSYSSDECLILDQNTRRNLELVEPMPGGRKEGSLIQILDHTSTPMGSRMLREWLLRPLRSREAINARLDVVEAFKDDPLTLCELLEMASVIRDLERITARINIGVATPRDIKTLSQSLKVIPGIKALLSGFDIPLLCEIRGKLHEHAELISEIDKTLVDEPPQSTTDGGLIREGFSNELDELRCASVKGKEWIAEFQAREQQKTKIKTLKVKYNKVFGYHIEVSKSYLQQVPQDYIRKQTLVNGERFITPELKEMENKIVGAEEKSKALEAEIFQKLRQKTLQWTNSILETASAIATLDALASFAECARKFNYTRPTLEENGVISIQGGRHPVLDAIMQEERFVPNDTLLDDDQNRIMIITGPNMAGKSTYIRQVGILALMAHCGSFIPAENATICILDRIFTRVGAADDISRGQSTFMVEMLETANILNHATSKSLVILDEIGRGTSTFDGISIAWAIAEYLHDKKKCGAKTLFATHYHELTELALTCEGVKNYNVAVREYGEQIIFLRQIVPGGTDKSYGIHVAKLAGLPKEVVERANEILENLENNAIAEAGQPALVKKKQSSVGHLSRQQSISTTISENQQPTLFDWVNSNTNNPF